LIQLQQLEGKERSDIDGCKSCDAKPEEGAVASFGSIALCRAGGGCGGARGRGSGGSSRSRNGGQRNTYFLANCLSGGKSVLEISPCASAVYTIGCTCDEGVVGAQTLDISGNTTTKVGTGKARIGACRIGR